MVTDFCRALDESKGDAEVPESSHEAYVTTTPKRPYPTLKGLNLLLCHMVAQMAQTTSAQTGVICRFELFE